MLFVAFDEGLTDVYFKKRNREMKKLTLILSLLLFGMLLWANSWQWARSIGSENMESAWDIITDLHGNIYVTGSFTDSMRVGATTIYGSGLDDIFVVKYDSNGDFIWARSFGSSEEDVALSIATDAEENIYITGFTTGVMTVGDSELNHAGMWDAFIIKLDSFGEVLLAKSFGGALNDIGYGIGVSAENIFVTGWFADTLSFEDGTSITSYGGSDIFLACLDENANPLWVRKAGTEGVEYGFDVCTDESAASYITGSCGENTNFEGFLLEGDGAFVAKYDVTGNFIWAKRMNGAGVNSIGYAVEYGMVTGRYSGTATFDDISISSVENSDDIYYAEFNPLTGEWLNVVSTGGAESDRGRTCNSTPSSMSFYAGSYSETQELFGFPVNSPLGGYDIYVHIKPLSSSDPAYANVVTAGGINDDIVTGVAHYIDVDSGEGWFAICGWHFGESFFGNHIIDSGSVANGNMFIAKYNYDLVPVEDHVLTAEKQIQIYPNPTSNSTNIRLNQRKGGKAKLSIYNIRGQFIKSVTQTDLAAGEHSFQWDGNDKNGKRTAPGIYFLRSELGEQKCIKKILRID